MMDESFVEAIGVGSVEVACDQVRIHVGAQAVADSVADAFSRVDTAMTRILEALRRHGGEDLQSTEVEVHSDHDRAGHPRGYLAAMSVRATLSDVSSAGSILSAAVEAGGDASRVHGLHLSSTSIQEALMAARQAAWNDARGRAEQYAELDGRSLGAVISVSELGGEGGSRPASVALAAASSAPVEAGSQTIRTTIAVRWHLSGAE